VAIVVSNIKQDTVNNKPKNWIKTLTLEAETAINFLPIHDEGQFRWLIAEKLS
jgi:hypothetical protein